MFVWLKRIGLACLMLIVLMLLVSVFLYVPPVQKMLVGKATEYVSKATGMDVGFERLRLSFPLNLSVRNATVVSSGTDTVAHLEKLTVHVRLRPLFRGNISVKGIHLEKFDLNTGKMMDKVIVKGAVGEAFLNADSINPGKGQALLNRLILSDADIHLFMCDSSDADTTKSDVKWLIDLRKVILRNVNFEFNAPCDSVYLDMNVADAVLSDGFVNLEKGEYSASNLRIGMDKISYGYLQTDESPVIRLFDVGLSLDSVYYQSIMDMRAHIGEFHAGDSSRLAIKSLTGSIKSDSVSIQAPALMAETDYSTLQLQAIVPWASINEKKSESRLSLNINALIDKKDAVSIFGNKSDDFQKYYPDTLFRLEASVSGNIKEIALKKFTAELPGAFKLDAAGVVSSLNDERLRTGKIDFKAEMQDMDFVTGMFASDNQKRFRIPDGMNLEGNLTVNKGQYEVETELRESVGRISLSANYNVFNSEYEAFLDIDSLEPVHFMPDDSIMWLSAYAKIGGQGTDIYKPASNAEIVCKINDIRYGRLSATDISLSGSLKNNHLEAELNSYFPLVRGRVSLDGEIKKNKIKGVIIADVDTVDFYGLEMTELPLSTSFQIFSELESNLNNNHSFDMTLGNWDINFNDRTIQPKMTTFAFRSEADTTRASFNAGDLDIVLNGNADLTTLSDKLTKLTANILTQLKRDSTVDLQALRPYFPDMSLKISAKLDNPIYNFLQQHNLFYEDFSLNATISPEDGLRATGALLAFVKDTLKIDTISFDIRQDTLGLQYEASVVKNRFRNQEAFMANAQGFIRKDSGDIFITYINNKGDKGLNFGLNIKKAAEGFDFHFYPENPVIAFIPFTINKDNYFNYKSISEIKANLRLEGSSQASLWIHSGDSEDSTKELMIELNQINMARIAEGFTGLPALKGLLNVSLRYEPVETSFMIVADGNIDDLYYENERIGELLLNATYIPVENGGHQVDFHVFHDMSEISSLSVLYEEGRYEDKIDGVFSIDKLPLNLFNSMMPGDIARLDGFIQGNFTVAGTSKTPLINGELQFNNGSMFVAPSSTTLYFDDKKVEMTKSKIKLNKFMVYTKKDNPFIIDGIIDASNISRPTVDLKMNASNLQLVDAKKSNENLAYGKLFVNFNSTLKGALQALNMQGNMRILGNTNLTYLMLDSPLDEQDGFNELVTFSYFADTLPRRTTRPINYMRRTRDMAMASGTDILLSINIDPVVKIRIGLDEEQSNYVEFKGGGDLTLQYSSQGDMSLNGKYALSDGTIRYSVPFIPLTDFIIKNGSYIDWNGDAMNPYLNISAYTRVRSSVDFDGQSRMVDFNAGIKMQDNLNDLSIKFLLEAPGDAIVQNQLTVMGEEERSKQAISLLVAGIYLASGRTENMDVGAALNSLLQREIKNMLGSLLGEVPFAFDVNTYDGTNGMGRRIDYMARFYKSFINERLNTTLGLRYSTKDPVFGNRLFLDDVSLEYRLDTEGSRSIKAFSAKEYESLFEGEISKIGASFSLRRTVKRFRDLFLPAKKETVVKEEDIKDGEVENED